MHVIKHYLLIPSMQVEPFRQGCEAQSSISSSHSLPLHRKNAFYQGVQNSFGCLNECSNLLKKVEHSFQKATAEESYYMNPGAQMHEKDPNPSTH